MRVEPCDQPDQQGDKHDPSDRLQVPTATE